jgi:2-methylisocitrate lyase-like PEP mutase family enzyme
VVAIAGAGARAIATTSAGVAWSLGVPDGAGLGAERAATVIAEIVAALDLPVSADTGRSRPVMRMSRRR